jgi:hypothetical protein
MDLLNIKASQKSKPVFLYKTIWNAWRPFYNVTNMINLHTMPVWQKKKLTAKRLIKIKIITAPSM